MGIGLRHSILVVVHWSLVVHNMLLFLQLISCIVEVCAHRLMRNTGCAVVRARTTHTIFVCAKFRGLVLAVVGFKLRSHRCGISIHHLIPAVVAISFLVLLSVAGVRCGRWIDS